jgi:hypothetical protein
MNINVKSKQKNPSPMTESIKPPTEEEKKFGALPQTPQLEQNQQAQATYYSAQSVGQIFETIFNIFSTRLGCTPLSQNERIALGEAGLQSLTNILEEKIQNGLCQLLLQLTNYFKQSCKFKK